MNRPTMETAARLVFAVQDNDQEACHRILGDASRRDLYELCVALAASVHQDDPLLAHYKPPAVPVEEIIEAACVVSGCLVDEFMGEKRNSEFQRARQIAAWIGAMSGYSYAELGRKFSQHHTTIMSNVDRVTRDPELHRFAIQAVEKIGADRIHESANGG